MVSTHNFNMRILSYHGHGLCLGSRLRMIFPISSAENVIVDKILLVRLLGLGESLVRLVIKGHCLETKLLKSLAFSLMSIMKRFS